MSELYVFPPRESSGRHSEESTHSAYSSNNNTNNNTTTSANASRSESEINRQSTATAATASATTYYGSTAATAAAPSRPTLDDLFGTAAPPTAASTAPTPSGGAGTAATEAAVGETVNEKEKEPREKEAGEAADPSNTNANGTQPLSPLSSPPQDPMQTSAAATAVAPAALPLLWSSLPAQLPLSANAAGDQSVGLDETILSALTARSRSHSPVSPNSSRQPPLMPGALNPQQHHYQMGTLYGASAAGGGGNSNGASPAAEALEHKGELTRAAASTTPSASPRVDSAGNVDARDGGEGERTPEQQQQPQRSQLHASPSSFSPWGDDNNSGGGAVDAAVPLLNLSGGGAAHRHTPKKARGVSSSKAAAAAAAGRTPEDARVAATQAAREAKAARWRVLEALDLAFLIQSNAAANTSPSKHAKSDAAAAAAAAAVPPLEDLPPALLLLYAAATQPPGQRPHHHHHHHDRDSHLLPTAHLLELLGGAARANRARRRREEGRRGMQLSERLYAQSFTRRERLERAARAEAEREAAAALAACTFAPSISPAAQRHPGKDPRSFMEQCVRWQEEAAARLARRYEARLEAATGPVDYVTPQSRRILLRSDRDARPALWEPNHGRARAESADAETEPRGYYYHIPITSTVEEEREGVLRRLAAEQQGAEDGNGSSSPLRITAGGEEKEEDGIGGGGGTLTITDDGGDGEQPADNNNRGNNNNISGVSNDRRATSVASGGSRAGKPKGGASVRAYLARVEEDAARRAEAAERLRRQWGEETRPLVSPETGAPFFRPNALPTRVKDGRVVSYAEMSAEEQAEVRRALREAGEEWVLQRYDRRREKGSDADNMATDTYTSAAEADAAIARMLARQEAEEERRRKNLERIRAAAAAEAPFRPEITPESAKMAARRTGGLKIYERELPRRKPIDEAAAEAERPFHVPTSVERVGAVAERSEAWAETREQRLQRAREREEARRMAECTFTPSRHTRTPLSLDGSPARHSRLGSTSGGGGGAAATADGLSSIKGTGNSRSRSRASPQAPSRADELAAAAEARLRNELEMLRAGQDPAVLAMLLGSSANSTGKGNTTAGGAREISPVYATHDGGPRRSLGSLSLRNAPRLSSTAHMGFNDQTVTLNGDNHNMNNKAAAAAAGYTPPRHSQSTGTTYARHQQQQQQQRWGSRGGGGGGARHRARGDSGSADRFFNLSGENDDDDYHNPYGDYNNNNAPTAAAADLSHYMMPPLSVSPIETDAVAAAGGCDASRPQPPLSSISQHGADADADDTDDIIARVLEGEEGERDSEIKGGVGGEAAAAGLGNHSNNAPTITGTDVQPRRYYAGNVQDADMDDEGDAQWAELDDQTEAILRRHGY